MANYPDYLNDGLAQKRRTPSTLWKCIKFLYRLSARIRCRFTLIPALFTAKEQMLNIAMANVEVNKVRGDYLEFGCYEGNSFLTAFHFAKRHKLNDMRFYAFDSFEGLPAYEGGDLIPQEDWMYLPGDYACDVHDFRRTLTRGGADMRKVVITKGFYKDTLNPQTRQAIATRKAAVVLIDCYMYESARRVLDFITDYLQDGSILIVDDWFDFKGRPDRGEQRAVREWLQANPGIRLTEYHKYYWHGISFIVHRD